jgi:hypothetical protein
LKSTITTCANIVLTTWNTAGCEAVISSCKVNTGATACESKVCADYTKTDGLSTGSTAVSTDTHCSTINSTCTIDNTAAAVKC